ncbi:MAG: hypothetical protein M3159_06975 [Actinomycetota bacterium]|nr:hypothetical protein [Actinomycetota bacterium]
MRYVVIGGLASQILGLALVTRDTDICYERSPENMERLAGALKELGAKLRVARVEEELPFLLDGKTIAAGDSFTFNTDAGAFDILAIPSGTSGFRDLDARAADYDLGDGLVVRVVDLDDLIRMKESAARPKDQAHLHELAVLKRTRDEADSPGSK